VSFCATLRVARSGSEPLKMYRARRLLDLLVWYQSELVELGKERSHEMLEIRFRPDSDEPPIVSAAAEYRRLWEAEGEEIVRQFATTTGLTFAVHAMDARVFEGTSQSDPLSLRASYDKETKLGTLIHELAHHLVQGHTARSAGSLDRPDRQRENHELIDLFLFDVWADLYGQTFARRQVDVESRRRPMYREVWAATLTLDRVGRAARLQVLLRTRGVEPSREHRRERTGSP